MKKRVIYLLIAVLGLAGTGWLVLPYAYNAIPGPYRHYVPEPIVAWVTTPLPTALPAPEQLATPPVIFIPTLPPTATPTVVSTFTPLPSTTPAPNETLPPTFTPVPSPTPTATPRPLPSTARIDGLTVVPQKYNNCGGATLSINLAFYGHDVPQLDISAVLKPNYEDRNISPSELVGYVQTQTNLRATVHWGGDLTLLKRLIAAGFPVIIEKGYEPFGYEDWMGHYLTLFGYDETEQVFYSMDSFLGPWDSSGRSEPYAETQRLWGHFNYVFVVVYPAEQEQALKAILGPTMLDEAAMWQQAALQAQADIANNQESAFAWFNLGSSLAQLGELTGEKVYYENAAAAFDQARTIGLPFRMLWYQFLPYTAYLQIGRFADVQTLLDATLSTPGGRNTEETFFYRGQLLLAQGDTTRARQAWETAVSLNPNYLPPQQALDALP